MGPGSLGRTHRDAGLHFCCVPECNSNHTGNVSVFRFPRDDKLREKWMRSITRKDFKPNDQSVDCIKHFVPEFVIYEDRAQRADGSWLCVKRTETSTRCISVDFSKLPANFLHNPQLRERNQKTVGLVWNCSTKRNWMSGIKRTLFSRMRTFVPMLHTMSQWNLVG